MTYEKNIYELYKKLTWGDYKALCPGGSFRVEKANDDYNNTGKDRIRWTYMNENSNNRFLAAKLATLLAQDVVESYYVGVYVVEQWHEVEPHILNRIEFYITEDPAIEKNAEKEKIKELLKEVLDDEEKAQRAERLRMEMDRQAQQKKRIQQKATESFNAFVEDKIDGPAKHFACLVCNTVEVRKDDGMVQVCGKCDATMDEVVKPLLTKDPGNVKNRPEKDKIEKIPAEILEGWREKMEIDDIVVIYENNERHVMRADIESCRVFSTADFFPPTNEEIKAFKKNIKDGTDTAARAAWRNARGSRILIRNADILCQMPKGCEPSSVYHADVSEARITCADILWLGANDKVRGYTDLAFYCKLHPEGRDCRGACLFWYGEDEEGGEAEGWTACPQLNLVPVDPAAKFRREEIAEDPLEE